MFPIEHKTPQFYRSHWSLQAFAFLVELVTKVQSRVQLGCKRCKEEVQKRNARLSEIGSSSSSVTVLGVCEEHTVRGDKEWRNGNPWSRSASAAWWPSRIAEDVRYEATWFLGPCRGVHRTKFIAWTWVRVRVLLLLLLPTLNFLHICRTLLFATLFILCIYSSATQLSRLSMYTFWKYL